MELNTIFDQKRELTPKEYKNLSKKVNGGYLPANYLRKNLFNATVKDSKELLRFKTIYDDGTMKMRVNRSLHQRHRDLLSILFSDNNGVSKPDKDGSYYIKTNLYQLAKFMGYGVKKKNNSTYGIPSATGIIEKFLNDLQSTLIVIDDEKLKCTYQLIGETFFDKHYKYDSNIQNYIIKIPALTAKYHIFSWGVQIPKEINRKIVAIPNKFSKIKAMVSLILSNKSLKNGISFESICDKLDILSSSSKSKFKRQIKDNPELLDKFNIKYDEERKIFFYENIKEIDFEKALKAESVEEEIQQKERELLIGEKVRFITKTGDMAMIVKSVVAKDDGFIVVGNDENGYNMELPYTKESLTRIIDNIKNKKSGLKEIEILKRDFLNRKFRQNIQNDFGGIEEALFEIIEFKPTDDESKFIALMRLPDGSIDNSKRAIDREALLGLRWV